MMVNNLRKSNILLLKSSNWFEISYVILYKLDTDCYWDIHGYWKMTTILSIINLIDKWL